MIRFVALAFVALLAFTFTLVAGEIKGKVKSTDAKKNEIVVTTKDGDTEKDVTVTTAKNTKFVQGKDAKDFEGGLEKLKTGAFVTITTADDDKDKDFKKGEATKVSIRGGKNPPPAR